MYHKSYMSFSHDYMFQAIDVNFILTLIDSEPKNTPENCFVDFKQLENRFLVRLLPG